ncbi:hypothetical protein [uncultured Bacteroides sp.]|uniref:hypothetical protein n=1 Tax=uncultured Bacteroides sp. TaxID=162156 RepID=UPI002617E041|nr:hypothetical protein [uncultured Bacteroides sp.]
MKRILYTLLILLCTGLSLSAQKLSKEEFRKRQEAFITQKAELTPQEAERFFPLYFELEDKKAACNKKAWEKIRKGKEENLTDAEYNDIVEDVIKLRIKGNELELEYVRKFKEFLPSKKIYNIQRAEMRFHRELLKNQKNRK